MTDAAPPTDKLSALDVFRFLAMAMMVQGHTFTAIADPAVRASLWGGYHGFIHGMTAPMFSFASGFGFGLSTLRSLHRGPIARAEARKRYERYATLIFLGYFMHMQAPSFVALLHAPAQRAAPWLAVDALQCIGVTLAVAQTLALVCRSSVGFVAGVATLLAVVVLGAPALDRATLAPLPVSVAAYLNDSTGSLFPIFPWAGYVLVGILAARALTDEAVRIRAHAARYVLGAAFVALTVARVGTTLAPDLLHPANFWKSSPWFFLGRCGCVLVVLGTMLAVVPRLRGTLWQEARPWLAAISAESLIVYIVHLAVLYGSPFTRSLRRHFDHDATLVTSSVLAAAIFVASIVAAIAWHALKRRIPEGTARGRRAVIGTLLLRFMLPV